MDKQQDRPSLLWIRRAGSLVVDGQQELSEIGFLILQRGVGLKKQMLPGILVSNIRSRGNELSHPVHYDGMVGEVEALFLDGRAG